MKEQEILDKANEMLQGKIKALSISNINHRPHPYTVGPRHITWAADEWGGMLSEEAIRDGEKRGAVHCTVNGCNASYDEHTSDRVLFLQLTQDLSNDEANELLKPLANAILIPEKIDGLTFVETSNKYRIKQST